ncbi:MAG: hypothetical protein DHS20C04_22440 [Hyphococcus sp.]|nr:MAG: hypothetical protein DHS20C04_22440 [Marinicaulis sp.]
MGGSIFLTLFFGVFLAVGVLILGFGLHSYFYGKQAAHWPTTPGTIIASDFVESSDDDGTTYRAKVEYRYTPDHVERTGKTIAFGYSGSSGQSYHREIYDALPVGAQVAVRYDPNKSDRAVLSHGVNRSIIFLLLFGAVWTMFTIGMAAMLIMSESGSNLVLENMTVYSSGR